MMKKGLVSKLGGAALVLSLVTASLVGGTFAKYTKTITGTGSATVAKFNLTESATNSATFDFGKISPSGQSLTKSIELTSDSDTEMTVSIDFAKVTGRELPSWAELYIKESAETGDGTIIDLSNPTATTFDLTATGSATYIITCKTTDTKVDVGASGQPAAPVEIGVTITGTQK